MNNNQNNTLYTFNLKHYIKRFFAYAIDGAISCFFAAFIAVFLHKLGVVGNINLRYLFSECVALILFSKDLIGIGKRLMKIRVISCKTGEKAAWYLRLFRNVTLFLMPIEIILLLLDRPRLGDQLCKTDVVFR